MACGKGGKGHGVLEGDLCLDCEVGRRGVIVGGCGYRA